MMMMTKQTFLNQHFSEKSHFRLTPLPFLPSAFIQCPPSVSVRMSSSVRVEEPRRLQWVRMENGQYPRNFGVEAGRDPNSGKMTYVARVEHRGSLVPTVMRVGDPGVKTWHANYWRSPYEILTAPTGTLSWVQPSWDELEDVPEDAVVAGYYWRGGPCYVTRSVDHPEEQAEVNYTEEFLVRNRKGREMHI